MGGEKKLQALLKHSSDMHWSRSTVNWLLMYVNVFLNQFGIPGPSETWIMPDKLYGTILCFVLFFWASPHLLQLL